MNDVPATKEKLSIREAVVVGMSGLGDRSRGLVIEHYAKQEADKQSVALIAGLDKLKTLELDLRKVKPQYAGFNEAGEGVGEAVFSKDQIEQRKKLTEQIEKLTKAINKADDAGDFGDLYNVSK